MDNTITVKGMHCNSCKMLVKMELEENGFDGKIKNIELREGDIGLVDLQDVSEDEIPKAKELINSMDSYEVVELA